MMKKEIRHKWFYEQSVEDVWEYLTTAELIEKWLMPNNFKLVLGHEFQFKTNPIPSLNLSGNFYCKVLDIVPLKKLVYSWKGGMSENEITLDSVVEWTIEEKENGTELNLFHSGFNEMNVSILESMTEGWDKHIKTMFKNLSEKNHGSTKP